LVTYNMKLFRDDMQYAANYLGYHIRVRRRKRISGSSNASFAIITELGSALDAIALKLVFDKHHLQK